MLALQMDTINVIYKCNTQCHDISTKQHAISYSSTSLSSQSLFFFSQLHLTLRN
eukprot:c40777_g1_i1 orf=187-348(-)